MGIRPVSMSLWIEPELLTTVDFVPIEPWQLVQYWVMYQCGPLVWLQVGQVPHLPLTHCWPVGQGFEEEQGPQAPFDPQSWPVGHWLDEVQAPHAPFTHTWLELHWEELEQAPQTPLAQT